MYLDFEHLLMMLNGEVQHVQVIAHAKLMATGAIELVGTVRDRAAAKLAQQALDVVDEQRVR